MLPVPSGYPYDVGHDPRLARALVTPGEAASITAIARDVRAALYADRWKPGERMPTRVKLADDYRVSPESAGVVMRILASEGLISLEQGRGTYVLPRRRYFVRLRVPAVPGGNADHEGAAARFLGAVAAEPAASSADAVFALPDLEAELIVETGGPAQAVTLALGLARTALGYDDRQRKAWDLDGASVRAEPDAGRA